MTQPKIDSQQTRRYGEAILLLAVFALSVVLRSFFAKQVTIVSPDGAFYGMLARKFLEHGFSESLHVYWSPLYPTLTGLFAFFIEDIEQAGRAVSTFFGGALVIPTYLLAKRFYGRSAAVVAVLLVAFYPFLIERSIRVGAESLYTFLFACMLWSGWLALERQQTRYYAFTGTILGLLYLTRTEAYAFVFPFVLFGLIRIAWSRSSRTLLRPFLAGSALVVCFILISSPYLLFVHDQTGRWSPGLRGINFVSSGKDREFRNNMHKLSADGTYSLSNLIFAEGRVKGYRFSKPQVDTGIDAIWVLEKGIERLYKVYRTFQPTLLPGLVIVFLALGLFGTPWDKTRLSQEGYLITIAVFTTLGYSLVHIKERYFVFLIPIFLVWTAQGLILFGGWGRNTLLQAFGLNLRRSAWIIAIAIVTLVLSFTPKYIK